MGRRPFGAILWVLVGAALTGAITWLAMPALMLVTESSPHGYEATIARLEQSLTARADWKVLAVNDYQKAVAPFGAIERAGSINVCNPRYASRILGNPADRSVTAFMPLAVGVYEDGSGDVYVTRLNVGLLGRMFGGTISEVMGQAGADLERAVASALEK
jgi:uncharacterized protein (DUF302 family)